MKEMVLPEQRRNALITALQRGVLPKLLKSHRYAIQLAPGQHGYNVTLVDGNGATQEGEFVYEQLGLPIPTDLNFDQFVQPYRREGNEFVKRLDGKEVRIRTLQANGTWQFTSAGRQWGLVERAEVNVRVPCTIRGTNDRGDDYNRGEDFLPYSSNQFPSIAIFALNSTLTDQQKDQFIINELKRELGITDVPILLRKFSGEEWWYDPTREHQWKVSKLITRPTAAGPSVSVTLNQPMGALSLHDTSSIPYPDQVLSVCFERHTDKLCTARALSSLLNQPMQDIMNSFDYCFDRAWRKRGITSIQLMKWCTMEGRNGYCIVRGPGGRWEVKHEKLEENKERGVAWCYMPGNPGHIYMYQDCHILASFVRGSALDEELNAAHDDISYNLQCDVEPRIRSDYNKENSDVPEVDVWKQWEGVIKPGYFWAEDLDQVRKELCSLGRSPKVGWDGKQYRQLTIQCIEALDECKGDCQIRILSKHYSEIQRWLYRIEELTGVKIPWQGEGLPNLTLQVFQILLRASRQNLTMQQKQAIRDAQNNQCAMCHVAEIQEFDHINPVRSTFKGQPQRCQGLCKPCHRKCTAFQMDQTRIQSQHSPFACRAYLDTPRSPALVFHANKDQGSPFQSQFDIIRCRFSACCHYDLDSFPCFCPLDNIVPFDITNPKLGDMNFVDVPVIAGRNCLLTEIPYVGPMWYSELECRFALSQGKIQWTDVKATYRATGRIPRSSVEAVLTLMESAWGSDNPLAKSSWNSAVGCMATEFLTRYKLVTSEAALPSFGTKLEEYHFEMDGEACTLYDHVTEQSLVSCFSYRSFHDAICGWEHVKLASMIYAARKMFSIDKRTMLEVATDSLLIARTKRKSIELDQLANMTYEEVGRLSNKPDGLARFKRAKPEVIYPIREGDSAKIFRKSRKVSHLPGSEYKDFRRRAELLTLSKIWRDIPAPLVNGRLNFDAILRHVLNGGNLYINGMGGAGKSTLGMSLVEQLRAMGKKVIVIAKTWAAVRRFNDEFAQTADKFLHWHVGEARGVLPDVLFCEEISMIDLRLWGYISTIFLAGKNRKCQIIVSGDLFQLRPPKNTWNGSELSKDALRNSDLLFELAGGNSTYLDCNMRSDPIIFEFAKTLRASGAVLAERLAAARQLFPVTMRIPDHVLVISHHKRLQYNEQLIALRKPLDAFRIELPTDLNCRDETQPQSMWIWPGMRVCGQRKPCVKSVMYDVVSCSPETIVLQQFDSPGANGRVVEGPRITVPTSKACQSFVMSFAITYMRAQGLTFSGVIVLSDCENRNFELEHLNMGITRATHSSLVEIR